MSKTIKSRYLTFFFCLDPSGSTDEGNEDKEERLHAVWRAAEKLIEARQHGLPQRTFIDNYEVECERWEYCDQIDYIEVHEGKRTWPIAFYIQDLPQKDIDALRTVCQASFVEVCAAAGAPVAYSHAELAITYEVTERTVLEPAEAAG